MRELSIFIDESGDFGPYEQHNPFYVFSLVFHNQANDISSQIKHINNQLEAFGLTAGHCFHTGPIVRREEDYLYATVAERRRYLNALMTFAKSSNIAFTSISVNKKHMNDELGLTINLSKKLSQFIKINYDFFHGFDRIIIYYDNGQVELTKIIGSIFSAFLVNTEFRKVVPAEYRLFQVADMFCTFELIRLKLEENMLSKTESSFFGNIRDLKKNYLKHIERMRFPEKMP